MSFVCYLYVLIFHLCVLICQSYVSRMYSFVIRMSVVCTRNVIRMSLVCTRISYLCYSNVLVCHPCVTRMYLYVIRMSLVYTRMPSVCHSYVLACHPDVTRMWFYHEPQRRFNVES